MTYIKTLLLFFFLSNHIYSQSQFSSVVDLNVGAENFVRDFYISDNTINLFTKHTCQEDLGTHICTSFSKMDFSGKLLSTIVLDSFVLEGNQQLLINQNEILLSGHKSQEAHRSIDLISIDEDFNLLESIQFGNSSTEVSNNNGLLFFQNAYYLFGNISDVNLNGRKSHLIKANEDSKRKIWDIRKSRTRSNDCFNLQPSKDGNLIYINNFSDGAGPQGDSGFQILKIDTSGNSIDSFEFQDSAINSWIAVAEDHGIIISTKNKISEPFPLSQGVINKLNKDLRTIEWSRELPFNSSNARFYTINDFYETSNKDILACGKVFDSDVSNPLDAVNNGFIVRLSPDGDIVWLRLYRLESGVVDENKSVFANASLFRIKETANGNIVAVGLSQFLDATNEFNLNLWVLSVDNNGCLSEDCDEVNFITDIYDDNLDLTNATLFPNPASEIISLNSVPSNLKYEIYNIESKRILVGDFIESINITGLISGTYFLKLKGSNFNHTFKFIKI